MFDTSIRMYLCVFFRRAGSMR